MVGKVKRKAYPITRTNIEVKLLVTNEKTKPIKLCKNTEKIKPNSNDIKFISIDLIKKKTIATNNEDKVK